MKAHSILMGVLWLLTTVPSSYTQSIFINEFLASNASVNADDAGEFDDWIELYNAGDTPVDIGGMYVTDELGEPLKWQIPSTDPSKTTIPPGGFLVLWFDGDPGQGVLHVDTKLSADGEDIGLFASDGVTQIDAFDFGPQSTDISYGRLPDGGGSFQFFTEPTPGASNTASPGTDKANAPVASVEGGFYNSNFTVTLTSATPGAVIHFTLDGSEPGVSSTIYNGPLSVSQTTTLRARAFASGLQPSTTTTHTYFMGHNHTFPVVALSFNESDFFDPVTGIYPNFEEDWERPVHMEFFKNDGSLALGQPALAEIHGTGSATLPQKSLRLKALSDGGSGFFEHPFFPNLPFDQYKRFILRNSGQDWTLTMFRDAMVASLAGDLSDVGNMIKEPDLHLQAFSPGIVYLNGTYWGIHNLREHMNENYVEQHFGLDENDIDFLDNDEVKSGSIDNWGDLTFFLSTSDLSDPANMTQYEQWVDLPHFLDYNVFNIIIDNTDWPGNNFRRWREQSGGTWQFMTYDLDFSFGLYNLLPGGNTWNTGDASANSLAHALDENSLVWPNPKWNTLYFRKAMENESFRRDYINRTADFLNILFRTERVQERIDAFAQLYQPEIDAHFERWSPGWNTWEENVEVLRQFASDRPQYIHQHVVDAFQEVNGTASVTLQAEPADGGSVSFSTVLLNPDKMPWTGTYFTGVEIPVKAIPAPGYIFDGWSDLSLGIDPATTITLAEDLVLTARFIQDTNPVEPIVINEINYNSPTSPNSGDWVELYNPSSQTYDLSDWTLEDESGGAYSIPAGTTLSPGSYLVLVESATEFLPVYPAVANYVGSFGDGPDGFKFSNNSERLLLKDANFIIIDSVRYDDELPWPPEADGTGSTLQLKQYLLDNALASSWVAQAPTPGQPNFPSLLPQSINFPPIPDQFADADPFAITATASSGLPVEFSILSGPANINGNMITLDGQVGIVMIRATQSGNNQYAAATPVVRAIRILLPQDPPSPVDPCSIQADRPWLEWIERVQFGDIDNTTFKTQYGDYTDISTEAAVDETLSLTITPAFSWEVFNEYFRAWIDFNRDGDFDDAGEKVLEASGTGPVTSAVTIPPDAAPGETRMRITMRRDQYAETCDNFILGEVEDYTVIITSGNIANRSDAIPVYELLLSPNPADHRLTAGFTTLYEGEIRFSIISANGTVLKEETRDLTKGVQSVTLDVSSLKGGSHVLWVKPEKQRAMAAPFIKVDE